MAHDATQDDALAIGQRAFDAFKHGINTGDAESFAALVAEDVEFRCPLWFDGWLGPQKGRQRVRELIATDHNTLRLRTVITQTSILANGRTVAVEFRNDGTNRSGEYHGKLAIFFDIGEDGLVTNFREYSGEIDPEAMGLVA